MRFRRSRSPQGCACKQTGSRAPRRSIPRGLFPNLQECISKIRCYFKSDLHLTCALVDGRNLGPNCVRVTTGHKPTFKEETLKMKLYYGFCQAIRTA